MYQLTEKGFSAEIGDKKIIFRNEYFNDGGMNYEGEATVLIGGRLAFVIRFCNQVDKNTRPILIDGWGEEDLPDLYIGELNEDDAIAMKQYFDTIYSFILEQIITQNINPLDKSQRFVINGFEALGKTATASSAGSSRVYVPKAWQGCRVMVIRLDPLDDDCV